MHTGKAMLTLTGLAGIATVTALSVQPVTIAKPAPDGAEHRFAHNHSHGGMELPFCAIFAPGTTPDEMVEAYNELRDLFGPGLEHMVGGAGIELQPVQRWPGTQGTPVDLTYSFPPDGTQTNNGPNVLHQTLNSQFSSEAAWKNRVRQAFDAWEEITGNTYTEVDDDGASWPNAPGFGTVRGDIRIVAAPLSGSTLAFNFFPSGGGDMLLNSNVNWGQGATNLAFRNVIVHENGHGMGLAHSCPQSATKIMEPALNTNFDGPQLDDRLAMQYLYGDALEPNNSFAAATKLIDDFGLESGVTLTINQLSLHSSSDNDVFRISAEGGSVVNQVQAAPQGTTYLAGAQNANGTCQPGTPFDSLRQQDLILEILTSGGQLLASSNSGGLGAVEEINGFALPQTADYLFRVRSAGSSGDPFPIQEYRFRINVDLAGLIGDLNGDGKVDGTDLAILLASWGTDGSASGADLNDDDMVNGADLAILLSNWTG